MVGKKYLVIKEIPINNEYTIKKGKHILVDWNGLDGETWQCIEDNTAGCPLCIGSGEEFIQEVF